MRNVTDEEVMEDLAKATEESRRKRTHRGRDRDSNRPCGTSMDTLKKWYVYYFIILPMIRERLNIDMLKLEVR